jgi:hypothetical protein
MRHAFSPTQKLITNVILPCVINSTVLRSSQTRLGWNYVALTRSHHTSSRINHKLINHYNYILLNRYRANQMKIRILFYINNGIIGFSGK